MKLAIHFGVSTYTSSNEDWASAVAYAVEAERLGVDSAWTAETWGYDGATPLAYLAAKTSRLRLGTGILQVGSRTPALTAMTAMALASLSGDRLLLGLGVSGPQVIEGWHGVRFARPLQRLRETVEIVRKVTRGERLVYHGEVYDVPLPDGEGKALTSSAPPRPNLPVYLATLGPKSLELTGELADGWLGTSFIPEHASLFFDPIAAGAAQVGRTLADLDLQVAAGVVAFSDDVERLIAPRKPGLAFTLGAMGSRQHNFYNDVFRRAGYADIALEVQDLWFKKQREAAAARIPDELVLKTNLIGTEEMVRERLRVHRRAGVNTLQVDPDGQTLDERLATLAHLVELVKEINEEIPMFGTGNSAGKSPKGASGAASKQARAAARVPSTEEHIRAAHVGELTPLVGPIQIVDYDPEWPRLFEREARRIRAALSDRVLLIEHVGSTSVPGLAAKPRIDILLVVTDSSDEPAYVPALEATGYVLCIREPDWYEHRVFKGPDTDVNLHVFSSGCPEIERTLLFRDWLRSNAADRLLYERTKRELARQDWKYTQNYADAKNDVIDEILARARRDSGEEEHEGD